MLKLRRKLLSLLVIVCLCAASADAPKLEEIFPETTLVAVALPDLAAAGKAADASRIGEMLRQPEMRAFLHPILARMKAGFIEARGNEEKAPTLDEIDKLFSGEIGIALFARGPGQPHGALLSLKPSDPAVIERLVKAELGGAAPPADPFPLGPDGGQLGVFITDGRLLMANPMSELTLVAERIKDVNKRAAGTLASSSAFTDARTAVSDPAGWIYFSPVEIVNHLSEIIPVANAAEIVQARQVLEQLGLDKIKSVMLSVSFSGAEPRFETFVGLDGAAKGIFELFTGAPVNKDMLQLAFADAPYVVVGSVDFSKILPLIRSVASVIEPGANAQFAGLLATAKEILGFDVEKDLLANLGSELVYTQTPFDTGLPLSFSRGMVGALKLKDAAKIEESLKKLSAVVGPQLQGEGTPAALAQVKTANYKGAQIYYLNQIVSLNGTIALAVVKDKLLFGDSLNAVKRGIDQLSANTNILSNKAFQTALARVSGQAFDANKLPASFTFGVDDGNGVGVLLMTGLGIAAGTAGVAGLAEATGRENPPGGVGAFGPFDELTQSAAGRAALKIADVVDLNLWPETEFFAQRRMPHAAVGMKTEKGWLSRTELPPPMPKSQISSPVIVGMVAVLAVAITPAFSRAREAGRRSVSADNLRQLHFALVMYNKENGKYPDDGAQLYPTKYLSDLRIFSNPRDPNLEAGYTLVTGISSKNQVIVAYENPPANAPRSGRNVLYTNGAVMFMSEDEFQEAIKDAENTAKLAGKVFKTVPLSMKEIEKKKRKE